MTASESAERPIATDRALWVAAAVEPVSLLVLFANLATVDVPGVAAAVGPLHGTAYLVAIAATWVGNRERRPRLLVWVPGVGALLALRTIRNHRLDHHPTPNHPVPAITPATGQKTPRP